MEKGKYFSTAQYCIQFIYMYISNHENANVFVLGGEIKQSLLV